MKNYQVLFGLILFLATFLVAGCDKKIVGPTPHSYSFYVKVINVNGENVLNDKNINALKNGISINESDNSSGFKVSFEDIEGHRSLLFSASSPPSKTMEEVSFTIEKDLFFEGIGPHKIRSVWIKEKNSVRLSRVFFDSKELDGAEGAVLFVINEPLKVVN